MVLGSKALKIRRFWPAAGSKCRLLHPAQTNTVKTARSDCRKWGCDLDILIIVHFKVGAPDRASWGTDRGCTNIDRCASALAKHEFDTAPT